MTKAKSTYHPQTQAIRLGEPRTGFKEHGEPIFTTSSFVFDSAEEMAERFNNTETGFVYSRFSNPTVSSFEQRLAALEGAKYALAIASGMAAINGLLMALLKTGDHVVASQGLFGATVSLFNKYWKKLGIEITYVDMQHSENFAHAIRPETKLFFLETPSNPLCQLADIKAIATIAQQNGIKLVVDNAFMTPVLQQPLLLGADIVMHSATKYIDGQGRCIGGVLATSDKDTYDELYGMLRTTGPSMSPFNAWVFAKGLETLSLRMMKHSENAQAVAEWLQNHSKVAQVYYPGLGQHPQYPLATRQHQGPGGVVSFEVKGGQKAAWKVINATRMISRTANLGDAKTTITHPASTTHSRISQQERDQAGISDSLLRIAAGLEYHEDIINDIRLGLDSL